MAELFLGTQCNKTRQAHERHSAWTSQTSQIFPLLRASVEGRKDRPAVMKAATWALLQQSVLYRDWRAAALSREIWRASNPAAPFHHHVRQRGQEPLIAHTAPADEEADAGASRALLWLHPPLGFCVPVQLVHLPSAPCMQEETSQRLMVGFPGPPVAPSSSVCSFRWKWVFSPHRHLMAAFPKAPFCRLRDGSLLPALLG